MTPGNDDPGRPLVGVALAVTAVALFALGDTVTKLLAGRQNVEWIGAIRYLTGFTILALVIGPRQGAALWRVQRRGLVFVRSLILAAATLIIGYTLRLLPVGETIAIMYLAPFAVMAIAVPLLGERVTPLGWALATLGFVGVLVIVRPGAALDPTGVALALVLAATNVAFHLMTRVLSRSESPMALLFWVNAVGCVFFLIAIVPKLDGPWPNLGDALIMAALGVLYTAGHFLFSIAYREAAASLIAPVNYLHFVWATLMGWVVFGHVPDLPTALGMALILVSGAALAGQAHWLSRRPPR